MPKLNDTQRIILCAALQRDDHSLHPLPDTIKAANRDKAIAALMTHGFAEERETNDPVQVHRTGGDISYGVFATESGIAALNGSDNAPTPPEPIPVTEPRITKSSTVLDLLRRDEGATLAELIAATNWLPHTTRAALTGLRKKGHAIERSKRGTDTSYRIAKAA
jgi:hypothetical protein